MSGDLRALAEASDAIRRELPEDCGGPHANYSAVFIENAIAKHAPGDEGDANLRRIWRADADFIAAATPAAILALLDERDALAAKVARVEALADRWAREAVKRGPVDQLYTDGVAAMLRAALKDQP